MLACHSSGSSRGERKKVNRATPQEDGGLAKGALRPFVSFGVKRCSVSICPVELRGGCGLVPSRPFRRRALSEEKRGERGERRERKLKKKKCRSKPTPGRDCLLRFGVVVVGIV
jgi:hypothetical protein